MTSWTAANRPLEGPTVEDNNGDLVCKVWDMKTANLIAAAPDMLSACEAIANGMRQSGGPVPYFLQNAIAKAKDFS